MPPPTVTCPICKASVNKRQTMMVEPYGRICRGHPEVEQHKAKLAEIAAKASQNKKLEEAMRGLQVMTIGEQIRMMAYGQDLNLVLTAVAWRLPEAIREKVEAYVHDKGSLTEKEAENAAFMATRMLMNGGKLP